MPARTPPTAPAKDDLWSEIRAQARVLGGFVGLLWVIHIVNAVLFQGALAGLGIHPRTLWGLAGIFFAPFLHASFAHIAANTLPLLVLGALVMQRRKRDLAIVSVISAVVGGLGVWLIGGAATVHIGASILVFGYLGYLLLRGVFERRVWPILGSIFVFFLYGGALWGVLPGQTGVSWQGHLFGLAGGILAARLLAAAPGGPATPPIKSRIAGIAASTRARIAPAPSPEEGSIEEELERLRRKGP
jgi:membrane associated rhomboid family serine protease